MLLKCLVFAGKCSVQKVVGLVCGYFGDGLASCARLLKWLVFDRNPHKVPMFLHRVPFIHGGTYRFESCTVYSHCSQFPSGGLELSYFRDPCALPCKGRSSSSFSFNTILIQSNLGNVPQRKFDPLSVSLHDNDDGDLDGKRPFSRGTLVSSLVMV